MDSKPHDTVSRVLVTGARGFVGSALLPALLAAGHRVRAAQRVAHSAPWPAAVEPVTVGEIDGNTPWAEALAGVDRVIHLAARVHVLHDKAADPLALSRRVNVDGTLNLARQAAQAGVRRLVLVSSVKVHGEGGGDVIYNETSPLAPQDPYGISKAEAEAGLRHIGAETGLEWSLLRPPLVYGPGVGANFLRLLRLVESGLPLPLGSVRNQRDMVGVGNLVSALMACAFHPAAANQAFLVCDGVPQSTPELIRAIAHALGLPARLWPFPPALMRLAASLLGRGDELTRLAGSLRIDASRIRQQLAWTPPLSVDQELARTVAWYRQRRGR
ncbi:MAG TPA: NAD-dependent epimerase/dehydratase family protein [Rhodocyclaceae bacterium]